MGESRGAELWDDDVASLRSVLRGGWWLMVGGLVAGAAIGAVAARSNAQSFSSTAEVRVTATSDTPLNAARAPAIDLDTEAVAVRSDRVVARAQKTLQLKVTTAE